MRKLQVYIGAAIVTLVLNCFIHREIYSLWAFIASAFQIGLFVWQALFRNKKPKVEECSELISIGIVAILNEAARIIIPVHN